MVVRQNDISRIEFSDGGRLRRWLLKHLLKNVMIDIHTEPASTTILLNFDGRKPGGWGSILYMYREEEAKL